MSQLNEKQKRFVEEYLVDLNATQAAIRAEYSRRTANEQGARLLANVNVQRAVQEAMEKRSRRLEITQDMVAEELRKIGFADAADCGDSSLKYSNKIRALELLGKHLGMFDGKGGQDAEKANNLLHAVKESVGEDVDTDDLPEVQ